MLNLKHQKKLISDVLTRWNSTYLMANIAAELKAAVQQALLTLDSNENSSGVEWKRLTDLADILRIDNRLVDRASCLQ
jgi:hypothetical protein